MAETGLKKCGKCGREWVPSITLDCFDINGVDVCERCAMPILMKSGVPEPINEERVENICKRGKGPATCAFLVMAPGFECAKGSSLESVLRQKLEEGSMGAKGDNCSGPPAFKSTVAQ